MRVNKIILLLLVCLICLIFLSSCSAPNPNPIENYLENNVDVQLSEIEADRFKLSVVSPKIVKPGEEIEIKGWLTYTGKRRITLAHDNLVVQFQIIDPKGEVFHGDSFFTNQPETKLRSNQSLDRTLTITFEDAGDYILKAETSSLFVNGELIDGVNNYFIEDQFTTDRIRELEQSRLTIEPMVIQVK